VRAACDVFHPVWSATGGRDGYVSLEVDPDLAADTKRTFDQAVELHERVGRPNVYIKIPATVEGLPAIEDSIARGIPINVTLIFSLERYRDVVSAYQRGLTRLIHEGGDPSKVSSVASFFVSRIDTEADRRLAELGNTELQGKLGIANAKLAYRHFQEAFSGPVWERMAEKGASKQRPLWASTSTKNPAYRDVMYVEELIGPDTVNTMPLETLEAFRDHGEARGDTVLEGVDGAQELLTELAAVGVDYDDLVRTLEREGVEKFAAAFDELIAGIEARRGELAAR
jgi:transaldolase